LVQHNAELLILIENSSSGLLHLGGGFDAHLLAHTPFGLELLQVLLSAGARPALVVSDASEIGLLAVQVSATRFM
jgi:hypothetical protein